MRTLWAALLLLLMGFSVGLFARLAPAQGALDYQRYEAMLRLLTDYNRRYQQLLVQRADDAQYLRVPGSVPVHLGSIKGEIDALQQAAGTASVSGQGLVVWMEDSKRAANGLPTNDFLIHDQDLMSVVNDLFGGGALAIAINGVRIGATTQIRCAGPVISIGLVRVAPPIVITAIGPPQGMLRQVTRHGGDLQTLKAFGMPLQLHVVRHADVPPVRS